MLSLFLGVDVGTGSVRAGVFDAQGRLQGTAAAEVKRHQAVSDQATQSSVEIWEGVCRAVKAAISACDIQSDQIIGLAFDATCSLVVEGPNGRHLTTSIDSMAGQDVVMWLDHRAKDDADAINSTQAEHLRYVGGSISPEMQMPKLRWLKREMRGVWDAAVRFWDLPDWLTYRATGRETRSMCSLVCKWAYLGQKGVKGEGWDTGFLDQIGLDDLSTDGFAKIGNRVSMGVNA